LKTSKQKMKKNIWQSCHFFLSFIGK
jgi:hypothetical protein